MDESFYPPPDWEALADVGGRLEGSLDAAHFDRRLAEALAMERAEGRVDYAFDLQRLANGPIAVSGRLHAALIARCQRCLEPFELAVELAPRLAFSPAGTAPVPGEDWEGIGDGLPSSLVAMIEEELLLGLPFAPRHPRGECPVSTSMSTPKADTQRPFAGLAEALKTRRDRGG
ncbi:MAG: YceD family protein [Gammaproteobacteria bacterium]